MILSTFVPGLPSAVGWGNHKMERLWPALSMQMELFVVCVIRTHTNNCYMHATLIHVMSVDTTVCTEPVVVTLKRYVVGQCYENYVYNDRDSLLQSHSAT